LALNLLNGLPLTGKYRLNIKWASMYFLKLFFFNLIKILGNLQNYFVQHLKMMMMKIILKLIKEKMLIV
jgi:hypothetical protein